MPVRKIESTINVLEAAKLRIRNVFANGCKVYLSFSSGKDSLCMASITYDLIRAGAISPKQLTVTFIDEEGLYPSMVEAAERWRRNFSSVGVPFLWFCLPFKQVSVIDHLSSSESWITWEPGKEDVWMRKPPQGAIMSSPYLEYPGTDELSDILCQGVCRWYSNDRPSYSGIAGHAYKLCPAPI